jgi:hypothetical protein
LAVAKKKEEATGKLTGNPKFDDDLLGYHFSPEDGDGMLLQNVGFYQLIHMAP